MVEIQKVHFQVLRVAGPRHLVDTRRCSLLKTAEGPAQNIDPDVMQERRQLGLFIPLWTASRMRACACDTASRLCVRTVLCSSAFSLAPPLRSTDSAAAEAALFAHFLATSGRSDFSFASVIGYGLRPSRQRPGHDWGDGDGDLPVPERKASAHARVYNDAGSARLLRYRHAPCCILRDGKHRHAELVLRAAQYLACTFPVKASRLPSRTTVHHLEPVRLATSSPWRTSTAYLPPVSRRTRPHHQRSAGPPSNPPWRYGSTEVRASVPTSNLRELTKRREM